MNKKANCSIHSGWAPAVQARAILDEKLDPLPNCQAGDAGHTCAYCAYMLGYENGKHDAKRTLKERVIEQVSAWFDDRGADA